MSLLTKLRENNGQIDWEDINEHMRDYDRAFKSLYKRKEYALLYKCLKSYIDSFKKALEGICVETYSPGMDYMFSYYAFYLYALMLDKGVKGVVEKDKEEATYAYLQLLKRIEHVDPDIRKHLFAKVNLLLKYAYPDLMDRYSIVLNYVGRYFYRKKDYKKAFKFFKKGADFDCDGRQIAYPFYLIGINQDKVGDMYRDGKGVKKDWRKAYEYYKKSAVNCGLEVHPKMGDFLLKMKRYVDAFYCYTEKNPHWPKRYSLFFMTPKNLYFKFGQIFCALCNKENKNRDDRITLAMMYKMGIACEKNDEEADKIMPKLPTWAENRIKIYLE